jgi:hypothetical protein
VSRDKKEIGDQLLYDIRTYVLLPEQGKYFYFPAKSVQQGCQQFQSQILVKSHRFLIIRLSPNLPSFENSGEDGYLSVAVARMMKLNV